MKIETIGYLSIPIIIWLTYKYDLKKIMFMTLILSTLSATAIVNVTVLGFSLTIGQFSGMLFILKTLYLAVKDKINYKIVLNKSLIIFMIIATISLTFPIIFSKGVIVLTPDDTYAEIKFSFQMITQFAYLCLGFITLICSVITCNNFKVTKDDFINSGKIIIYIYIVLVVLQMIVPLEVYNCIFRAAHFSGNQWLPGDILRLTGPTSEASIFAFTCMPIIAVVLFDAIESHKFKCSIAPLSLLILVALTKSSTFLVSLALIIIMAMIYVIKNFDLINTIKASNIKIKIILSVGGIVITLAFLLIFKDTIIILVNKLIGVGESGQARTNALIHHLKVFIRYPFTGVGFGTVRSYDLLSMWLASIGGIGMGAIAIYIATLILGMMKKKENVIFSIYLIIVVTNLLISIPEPYYLFIWISIGIMQFNYKSNQDINIESVNENLKYCM